MKVPVTPGTERWSVPEGGGQVRPWGQALGDSTTQEHPHIQAYFPPSPPGAPAAERQAGALTSEGQDGEWGWGSLRLCIHDSELPSTVRVFTWGLHPTPPSWAVQVGQQ